MAMASHGEGRPLLQGAESATRSSYGHEAEVRRDRTLKGSMQSLFTILMFIICIGVFLILMIVRGRGRDVSVGETDGPDYRGSFEKLPDVATGAQSAPGYPRGSGHGNPSRDVHGFDGYVQHRVEVDRSGENVTPSRLAGDRPGEHGGLANHPARTRSDGSSPREGDSSEPQGDETHGSTKPNIFFFLVDDMGWGDMGYQSTDFAELTPNFDALASKGIKLSNYYSMHICTPARASLMTGRYPVRYGMQYFIILPGAPWSLPRNEKLLPEYLQDAGYESHMVGKWHIGSYRYDTLPQNRGFDTFLGYLHGEEDYWTHESAEAVLSDRYFFDFGYGNQTSYYDVATSPNVVPDSGVVDELWDASAAGVTGYPLPNLRGGESRKRDESFVTSMIDGDWEAVTAAEADQSPAVDEASKAYVGVYSEDVFSARVQRILAEKTPWDEKPLFLYMAHQSVHSPLGEPPEDGFTAEEMEILKRLNTTSSQRVRISRTLFYLDKKFGETMAELEAQGWLENSVIVVASDNGACFVDGGTNYPWRGGKQSVFEGGTKVPAFVYSKSHIPEELWGTTHDGVVHVTDWVPTFATLAGSEISGSHGPLDGVDQWAALMDVTGQTRAREEMLYNWDQYIMSSSHGLKRCNERTQGAFRKGKWKFVTNGWCSTYNSYDPVVQGNDPLLDVDVLCGTKGGCEDCNDACQKSTDYMFGDWLFNLEEDPRETTNLILEYPEVAEELRQRATEVVYSESIDSLLKTVNEDSYDIWARHGWWMMPWYEELMGAGSE